MKNIVLKRKLNFRRPSICLPLFDIYDYKLDDVFIQFFTDLSNKYEIFLIFWYIENTVPFKYITEMVKKYNDLFVKIGVKIKKYSNVSEIKNDKTYIWYKMVNTNNINSNNGFNSWRFKYVYNNPNEFVYGLNVLDSILTFSSMKKEIIDVSEEESAIENSNIRT